MQCQHISAGCARLRHHVTAQDPWLSLNASDTSNVDREARAQFVTVAVKLLQSHRFAMDVAGTAVGVASLGIQVCQGLLDYYQACASFNADIQEARIWVIRLQRTLVILGNVLQGVNARHDVFQNAQSGILNCEDGIRRLETKLRKINKGCPTTAREKFKALGHRLAYPFQQSTLAKLKEIVRDLIGQLSLSMQVLLVDTDLSTRSLAAHIDDTVASLSTSTDGLQIAARSHQAQLAQLSECVKNVNAGTIAIHSELIGLPDQINHVITGLLSRFEVSEAKRFNMGQMFDVLNWLKAPDPSPHYLGALKKYHQGTGQWLFQTRQYLDWSAGVYPWLWMSGDPGKGKTVLCAQVIKRLSDKTRNRRAEVVAYFFFSFRAVLSHSPYRTLLLSLIAQLTDRQGDLLPDLQQACVDDDRTIQTLDSILLQLLQMQNMTYIVIDAMDECPEACCQREDVLDGLHRLSTAAANVRIFVTSRPSAEGSEAFVRSDKMRVLRLGHPPRDDLHLFLTKAMGNDRQFTKLDTALRDEIVDRLCRKNIS